MSRSRELGSSAEPDPLYWYSEDDIRAILTSKVDHLENVEILAQTQMEHEHLARENFNIATARVLVGNKIALIPIHSSGNHWSGAVIRKRVDGLVQVIFNDSLGESWQSNDNAALLYQCVEQIAGEGNVDLIDIKLRQQYNGNDCGPYAVDNMLTTLSYAIDPANNPDELDQESARAILANPGVRCAFEIRRNHAELMPDLLPNHTSSKGLLSEEEVKALSNPDQERLDMNFYRDMLSLKHAEGLLSNLRGMLKKLPKESDGHGDLDMSFILEGLKALGDQLQSLSRFDIGKSSVRKKYGDIIGLDQLSHLSDIDPAVGFPEGFDFEGLEKDMQQLIFALKSIFHDEQVRIKEVSNMVEGAQGIPSKISDDDVDLYVKPLLYIKKIAAQHFAPKALHQIFTTLDVVDSHDFDFSKMEDRYVFARVFTIIGELSNKISDFVEEASPFYQLCKSLSSLRNELKSYNHFDVVVANDVEKIEIMQRVWSGVSSYKAEILKLITDPNYSSIEVSSSLEVFQSGVNDLSHKASDSKSGTSAIKKIIKEIAKCDKDLQPLQKAYKSADDYRALKEQDSYLLLYEKLPAGVKELFPSSGAMEDLILARKKVGKQKKVARSDADNPDYRNFIQFVKRIRAEYKSDADIDRNESRALLIATKMKDLLRSYGEERDKLPFEEVVLFPTLDDDAVANCVGFDAKEKEIKFAELSGKVDSELDRLKEIYASDHPHRDPIVTHITGLVGEMLKSLLGTDYSQYFSAVLSEESLRDLGTVRFVRNSKVMHDVASCDSQFIDQVASRQMLVSAKEIKACSMLYRFASFRNWNFDDLWQEAKALNPDVTREQLQARMMIVMANNYFRTSKYEEMAITVRDLRIFCSTLSPEKRSGIFEEECYADSLAVGPILSSQMTLEESIEQMKKSVAKIDRLEPGSLSKNIVRFKASILNNLGSIHNSRGHKSEAIKCLTRVSEECSNSVLAVNAICQHAEIVCDESDRDSVLRAIRMTLKAITNETKRSGGKVTSDNIFQLMMANRQLRIFSDQVGSKKMSQAAFEQYSKLSDRDDLLRPLLGKGYNTSKANFLHDYADMCASDGHLIKAISLFQRAAVLASKASDSNAQETVRQCYYNIAFTYKNLAIVTADPAIKESYYAMSLDNFAHFCRLERVAVKDKKTSFIADCHAEVALILTSYEHSSANNFKKRAERLYMQEQGVGKDRVCKLHSQMVVRGRGCEWQISNEVYVDYEKSLEQSKFNQARFDDIKVNMSAIKDRADRHRDFNPEYLMALQSLINICAKSVKTHSSLQEVHAYCQELDNFVTARPDCNNAAVRSQINKVLVANGIEYDWQSPAAIPLVRPPELKVKDFDITILATDPSQSPSPSGGSAATKATAAKSSGR